VAERTNIRDSYQLSFDNLQRHIRTAEEQGKHMFVKEHVNWMIEPVAETKFIYGEESTDEIPWTVNTDAEQTHSALNKTIIPDGFLKTWFPAFLIRHPALEFPSNYKTCVDNEGKEAVKKEANLQALEMTFHWTRTLYDWYTQYFQTSEIKSSKDIIWPILLEADDIMLEPKLVFEYAKIIGLDPTKLKFSWTPKRKEELDKLWDVEKRMLSTISASAGILEGKTASGIVIDDEVVKWKGEFGEDEGAKIERWVRGAMMDYAYLKARRFKI
jgi:hypothetical protein